MHANSDWPAGLPAEWTVALPAEGAPQQLMVLVPGPGQPADALAALVAPLRATFAQAALVALAPADGVDAVLAGVRQAQAASGLDAAATALFGHAAGARRVLEAVHAHDGLAGRAVVFGGDYAEPPAAAPRATTLHWLHGEADTRVPVARVRAHFERLAELGADATLDVAQGVDERLAPVLIDEALRRLRGHIPARTWRAALSGQV